MKQFHLTTCVWGDWHIEMMSKIMLPTLITKNNLPALSKLFDVTYKISTTNKDRENIEHIVNDLGLKNHCNIEIIIDTKEDNPGHIHHVNWYHTAIKQAKEKNALCAFIPPDVAWSSNTFKNMGQFMAEGKLATAMPYLRVISETCIPELINMEVDSEKALRLDPGELVNLSVKHIHPLSAAASSSSVHGRPSLEVIWRVPGEGLILRHIVRELFSFDPTRLELTHLWYATGDVKPEQIKIVDNSDDMFMLSFAPLLKDIPLYIQDHSVTPMDIARMSLHPLNDTPLNNDFPKHKIRLHYGNTTESKWQPIEKKSDLFIKRVLFRRETLQIWHSLKEIGNCEKACEIISMLLQDSKLDYLWPLDKPCTFFIPIDEIIQIDISSLYQLKPIERIKWAMSHVVEGIIDATSCKKGSFTAISETNTITSPEILESHIIARHQVHLTKDNIVGV